MATSIATTDPATKDSTTLDALSSVPHPSQGSVKHTSLDLSAPASSQLKIIPIESDKDQPDSTSTTAIKSADSISNTDLINGIAQANASVDGLTPLQLEFTIDTAEVIPVFDFVGKLKASDSTHGAKLFELTERFSHVRQFTKSHQSVFLAVAFAFFEQFFLKGMHLKNYAEVYPFLTKVLKQDIDTSVGASKFSYRQLIEDIKSFIQSGDLCKGSPLYESMCYSSGVYEASLILFTEIIIENLNTSDALIPSDLKAPTIPAFRWMNNVPLTNEEFYKGLSHILNASLSVIVLSASQMEHKFFTFRDPTETPHGSKDLPEVILFIDRRNGSTYLLYTTKEQRKSHDESQKKLVKQPSTFNFLKTVQRQGTNKKLVSPPIVDDLKTPSARSSEKRRGSFSIPAQEQDETESFTFSNESYIKRKQKEEFMSALPPQKDGSVSPVKRPTEYAGTEYKNMIEEMDAMLERALNNAKLAAMKQAEKPKKVRILICN